MEQSNQDQKQQQQAQQAQQQHQKPPEEVFVSIDLESSLGRIDGDDDGNRAKADRPQTKTTVYRRPSYEEYVQPWKPQDVDDLRRIVSPQVPDKKKVFRMGSRSLETAAAVAGVSGAGGDLPIMMDLGDDDMMMDADLDVPRTNDATNDDDFSLTSHEAGSLMDDETFEFDEFQEDPSSFWLHEDDIATDVSKAATAAAARAATAARTATATSAPPKSGKDLSYLRLRRSQACQISVGSSCSSSSSAGL